jgi:hypothetical protein
MPLHEFNVVGLYQTVAHLEIVLGIIRRSMDKHMVNKAGGAAEVKTNVGGFDQFNVGIEDEQEQDQPGEKNLGPENPLILSTNHRRGDPSQVAALE